MFVIIIIGQENTSKFLVRITDVRCESSSVLFFLHLFIMIHSGDFHYYIWLWLCLVALKCHRCQNRDAECLKVPLPTRMLLISASLMNIKEMEIKQNVCISWILLYYYILGSDALRLFIQGNLLLSILCPIFILRPSHTSSKEFTKVKRLNW